MKQYLHAAGMHKIHIAAVVIAGLLSACASQVPVPSEAKEHAPANFPEAYYQQALAQGRLVFGVNPAMSLLVIEVRRGGSLAHVGHDHVIASHNLQGYVMPEDSRSDLYVQLDKLVVDEPELRAEARLDTQPSEDDIAGTRHNMLNALQAEQYPFALIKITRGGTDASGTRLNVAIALHGTTRTLEVPVQIDTNADELQVTGRVAFNQTDFGIKPLSILGGAIQVQDQVNLRFSIRARRIK